MLLTVLITAFKVKEYPPEQFTRYNATRQDEPQPVRRGFLDLMRNMPRTMVRLGITQFCSWAALFLMWNYLKPLITASFVDPASGNVDIGAAETWTGVLNAVYPVPACIMAIFMTQLASKWGNKTVYACCLLCGAIGYFGLTAVENRYLQMLPMVFIGIAWAGILAMPYAILSRAIDARNAGAYMGIFNFTITIPQICMGLVGGLIVKAVKPFVLGGQRYELLSRVEQVQTDSTTAGWMIALAGAFMLLAALSVHFITEKHHEA